MNYIRLDCVFFYLVNKTILSCYVCREEKRVQWVRSQCWMSLCTVHTSNTYLHRTNCQILDRKWSVSQNIHIS